MRLGKQSRNYVDVHSAIPFLTSASENINTEYTPVSGCRSGSVPAVGIPLTNTIVHDSNYFSGADKCEPENSGDATIELKQLLASMTGTGRIWPEQQPSFNESALHEKQRLFCLGDSPSLLSVEHSLITTSISSCEESMCMMYVSPQIANLGFAPETWLGKTDLRLELVHEGDRERVDKALRHSLNTGEKFNCCYRLYDSCRKIRWFHDEASVVCNDLGVPVFIKGVMLDITDQKNMEEELKQYRYQLDRHVERNAARLMKRIAVLEFCNSVLSRKLKSSK